jgi:hypothetical protein
VNQGILRTCIDTDAVDKDLSVHCHCRYLITRDGNGITVRPVMKNSPKDEHILILTCCSVKKL